MVDTKYSLSFTTGALLYHESVKLAELYFDLGAWPTVRTQVLDQNLLQARTLSTAKKICREIISRLKLLTPDEMEILVDGTTQEQGHMLWLAVCKRYRFIFDFATEVLREKFLHLDLELFQRPEADRLAGVRFEAGALCRHSRAQCFCVENL